jgi:predicted acyl esterase
MPDGVRLAVTLYMPKGAPPGARFPVLLEYLPYRKDDGTAAHDVGVHSYFARRGYVGARVDVRGSGNSTGMVTNREYSLQELSDCEVVINWLAHQAWSNGRIGMFGISWGGINSLLVAMRNPPALKAILSADASEALFNEDVHYIDGIFHFDQFELAMDLRQGFSGAPEYSVDEAVIGPRMDSEPWSLVYLKHQRDDAFWHEVVRPLETIHVPCFLIGGFADGYRDVIPRVLERVRAPVKAWIGPWNHGYPNGSDYGPLYEWRDQAVRWFDYWLKGRDTGVLADPQVTVYLQHWHPPGDSPQTIPGEWRADSWPLHGLTQTTLYVAEGHRLAREPSGLGRDELQYVPSAGVEAGFWWGDLLMDQRPVDAFSLVYDSSPLVTDLAIIGRPRVQLRASADVAQANWFVRLEDVAPNGQVTLVTGAGINGAQRESMAEPRALDPGQFYSLPIALHLASWVFPVGHRVRLAVSNALWPMEWPTPSPMTTALEFGGADPSRVTLPQVPIHGPPAPAMHNPEPIETRSDITNGGGVWPGSWTLRRDEEAGRSTVVWEGRGWIKYPWGRMDANQRIAYDVDDAHPDTARVASEFEYAQEVGGHVITWRGYHKITSDATTFYYRYTRELLKDGVLLRSKTWSEPIPRDHQ